MNVILDRVNDLDLKTANICRPNGKITGSISLIYTLKWLKDVTNTMQI